MKYLFAVALFACLTPFVAADEKPIKKDKPEDKATAVEENPYKKAKVGDWAEYKMTTALGGLKLEGTLKTTVSDKTEKEATVKSTISLAGTEMPGPESKIDLTKPYDPNSTTALPTGDELKVEKISDGKEKIKIGDKEYDCTWTKSKLKGKANGMEIDAEAKVWTCKSVPLDGMVKTELKSDILNLTLELTETGSKK